MAASNSPAAHLRVVITPPWRSGAEAAFGREPAPEVARGFEHWYRTHFDYVWRSLRRLGVPTSDIGDLAHDVFVVAWKRRHSIDPNRPVKAWLFGVAFRIAAAHRRRAWFRRVESEPDPPAVDPHLTPEQALLLQADLRRLQDAIVKVPLRLRAVLLLHDFDEVPVAEAAAALGIPVKTAYSRLAAARKRFRQAFRQAELGPQASPAGDEP